MTSVAALGHPEVSVADFADTIEPSFARVFGYGCTERIDATSLTTPTEGPSPGCEARS